MKSGTAPRLILYIVVVSSFFAFFTTAFQLYQDYNHDLDLINSRMEEIQDIHLDILANNVWSADRERLQLHLEGLFNLPEIKFMEIREGEKVWASIGAGLSENNITRQFTLTHNSQGKNVEIGVLTVMMDLGEVYDRIIGKIWVILISNGIKTFLVSGFIFFIFYFLITRHLIKIARYTENFDLIKSGEPLVLDRKMAVNSKSDELDNVVSAINNLQGEITETLKDLEKSRERTELAMESANEGVWEWDYESGELVFSENWIRNLGYRPGEEDFSQSWWNRNVHPKSYQEADRAIRDYLESGKKFFEFEYCIRTKSGGWKWSRVRGKCVKFDRKNRPVKLIGTQMDITEKKLIEEAYQEQDRQFRNMLTYAGDGIFSVDQNGTIESFNPAAARIFGYKAEEVIGRNIEILVPPEFREKHRNGIKKYLETGQSKVIGKSSELQGLRKDGNLVSLEITINEIHTTSQIKFSGIFRDITKRKKTEEEVRASQRLLQTVFDTIPHPVFVRDLEGRYVIVNNAMAARFDSQVEDFVGKDMIAFPLGDEENMKLLLETDQQVMGEGVRIEVPEAYVRLPDGGEMITRLIKLPLLDENGAVKGLVGISEDITVRKKTEKERTRLFTAVSQVDDMIFITDPEGIIQYVNPAFENKTGFSSKEAIGRNPNMLKSGALDDSVYENMWRTISEGGVWKGNIINKAKDGTHFEVEQSITPVLDESGQTINYIAVQKDITEWKKTQNALRESRNLLQTVFDTIPHRIYVKDIETRYLKVNRAFAETQGLEAEEIVGIKTEDFTGYPEQHRWLYAENDFKTIASGKRQEFPEVPIRHSDGTLAYYDVIKVPLRDDNGEIIGILGIDSNVTEKISAERELRESRSLLRTVLDTIPLGLFVKDREARYVMANKTFADQFGLSPKELIGKTVEELDYFSEESVNEVNREFRLVIESGEGIDIPELLITKKDGGTSYHHRASLPVLDKEGNISRVVSVSWDISDRILAEGDRMRLSKAMDQTAEGIVITDEKGIIQYVNPAFEKITGYSKDEVIGKNPKVLNSGEHDKKFFENMWNTILGGDVWSGQLTNRRKDGSHYEEKMNISPVKDRMGRLINFIAVKRDITEEIQKEEKLKMQQQQLIQADKMTSLGILVSGVAHEINNPNTSILLNVPLVKRIWDDARPILDSHLESEKDFKLGSLSYQQAIMEFDLMLGDIEGGSRRVRDIVQKLKNFAGKNEYNEFYPFNINEVVESAIGLLSGQIKKMTKNFMVNYCQEIKIVKGNSQEIEQVLINLINNACQSLETNNKAVSVLTSVDNDSGDIVIQVVDEGVGIDQNNLGKIMDPFFTTKRENGGTGLGLSISYGIIEEHGGRLEFSSVVGKGTTATISLPSL